MHTDAKGHAVDHHRRRAGAAGRRGRRRLFGSKQGIGDRQLFQVQTDGHGHVWVGSSRGILRLSERELDEVAAGRRPGLHPLSLDVSDRRRDVVSTNVRQPGSLRDRPGRLWFATEHGPLMIDPARLQLNAAAARGAHRERVRRRAAGPARTGQRAAPRAGQPGVPVLGGDPAGTAQEPAPVHAGGFRSAAGSRPVRGGWPTTPTFRPVGTASASRAATPTASGTQRGDTLQFRLRPHFYRTAWFYSAAGGAAAGGGDRAVAVARAQPAPRIPGGVHRAQPGGARAARHLVAGDVGGRPAAARPAPAPGQRGARRRPRDGSAGGDHHQQPAGDPAVPQRSARAAGRRRRPGGGAGTPGRAADRRARARDRR